MKKALLVVLVAGLVLSLAGMASAWVQFSENWESYTSGTTPYDSWTLNNGAWMPLSGGAGATADNLQSYRVTAAGTSRISHLAGMNLASASDVILEGYFYDSNGASSSKRSWLGFQNCTGATANVTGALLRIGGNNLATYQVHYYTTALQTVNTGVANATGWHYVKLENVKNGTNWTTTWTLDTATGTFAWNWDAAGANNVTLGYNYSSTVEVDWDNISLSVPEPGSMLALGTGLIGLLGMIRRRRRA